MATKYVKPKTIAIPLKYMKSEAFDVHVEVGERVKIGTKIATGKDITLYATVSGKVLAIEKRDHVALKKTEHIVIENDFLDEKLLPTDDMQIYERVVTIAGDGFKNPQDVQVRIGTILKDVIEAIGGYVENLDPKNARLVAGDALTGSSIITDDLSILSTTDTFLCLTNTEKEVLPCMRCGNCISHCPIGLQPVQIMMSNKNRDLLEKLGVNHCTECGRCSSVCPSFIELTSAVTKAKTFFKKA